MLQSLLLRLQEGVRTLNFELSKYNRVFYKIKHHSMICTVYSIHYCPFTNKMKTLITRFLSSIISCQRLNLHAKLLFLPLKFLTHFLYQLQVYKCDYLLSVNGFQVEW